MTLENAKKLVKGCAEQMHGHAQPLPAVGTRNALGHVALRGSANGVAVSL